MQQVDDFLEADLSGQFVDVVAAVDQFADVTSDVAEASMRSDNTFQTLRNSILSTHCTYPAGRIDRRSNLTTSKGPSTVFAPSLRFVDRAAHKVAVEKRASFQPLFSNERCFVKCCSSTSS